MSGRHIRVSGLVQGVGFRPYVWRLANELGLAGWVLNDGAGVSITVDGEKCAEFLRRLPAELPRLARIDALEVVETAFAGTAVGEAPAFVIRDSLAGVVRTAIGPDAAICPDCIADICDPAGRRWRYAFTTCTHCGPRYTVSAGIPYDRARTSLAAFPLCPPCASEYADAVDRRFHAETTCCPTCGPQLQLLDALGQPIAGDPIAETLARLRAGQIVAIKGLGGFHLACDAHCAGAVASLRQRKQREAKPLAIMVLNAASVGDLADISADQALLFASAEAPIVLCPKGPADLPGIAPGLGWIGLMRPATPLHLLLWHEAAGRPAGTDWLAAPNDLRLVMTSANPHGEPLVIDNAEARARLAGIADAFLQHDRDILVRCDDSVLRSTPAGPAFLRRARGYTPVPVALADDGPCMLAFGGYLKNTLCVMKGRQAFLSQHIGGLDNAAAIGFLEETVAHLLQILDVRPELVAHDLHPDFPSTRLAVAFAAEKGIPAVAVAHHHAHLGAICAEHALNSPLIGLAIDGVGLGPDNGLWGGELLLLDGADCQRLGHLRPLALPGGEQAAREPWRMAISALHAAGQAAAVPAWLARRFPEYAASERHQPLLTMLARGFHCPPTSSLGRLFDAAAGLLGVCARNDYEGQAAMWLEGLAQRHGAVDPLEGGFLVTCWPNIGLNKPDSGDCSLQIASTVLDFSPLLLALADCPDAALGAAQFHATVAAGLSEWLLSSPPGAGQPVHQVAVAGGCAMNQVLMAGLEQRLNAAGVALLQARQVPPNDGGLALGQAWVARQMIKEKMNVSGNSRASR
jgi:hydrogenase maturation protein HypF